MMVQGRFAHAGDAGQVLDPDRLIEMIAQPADGGGNPIGLGAQADRLPEPAASRTGGSAAPAIAIMAAANFFGSPICR